MVDTPKSDPFNPVEAVRLIGRIRAGSVEAWHEFIDIGTPLIHRVLRRYLTSFGSEDKRDLYVSMLASLYQGDLYGYDGRTRLTTWLFIYSRSRCLDHIRHVRGRRTLPDWIRGFPAFDQAVYRLYYLQGLGGREVCHRLSASGTSVTMDVLAESLAKLEQYVDDGVRKRTAYELQARSIGFVSGKLLEYLHRLKIEHEITEEAGRPDAEIMQRDVRKVLDLVHRFIERLPDIERKVIAMRFYDRRSAREIADRLGLDGQRRVYTLEGRALKRLRSLFEK